MGDVPILLSSLESELPLLLLPSVKHRLTTKRRMSMLWKPDVSTAAAWYNEGRKWFLITPLLASPTTFLINAPFGRFSPKGESIFMVDGIKSWILMELVSPLCFLYSYYISPLTPRTHTPSLRDPTTPFVALFLIHYTNRALLSPLRTPSRSKSHLMVPLAAVLFNTVNGSLLGTYFSSTQGISSAASMPNWRFWLGLGMWAAGFVGNIVHDEMLLNIRRNKMGEQEQQKAEGKKPKENHYAIPHGLLYNFISYPNYFCEWIEWIGFALACSPVPSLASGAEFMRTVSPPWLFLIAEVATMLPRAWKGHKWYHEKFPDYPKERRAVVPFIF
ncbi:hypothetical protein OE88DRAFT_1660247 [Heliocybe sulcata]|uniref:3-oxo-5-alpha-steroid 4-dehydrogenase C-terminal domain-containing protein n=1 Tax=Heliocybe sulcata TaxID=5364 RepID=A0A5C3N3L6_9AGAM|nr:hypothetical protein OE88DRAFT_1660247 [Heliocybe sulcata]